MCSTAAAGEHHRLAEERAVSGAARGGRGLGGGREGGGHVGLPAAFVADVVRVRNTSSRVGWRRSTSTASMPASSRARTRSMRRRVGGDRCGDDEPGVVDRGFAGDECGEGTGSRDQLRRARDGDVDAVGADPRLQLLGGAVRDRAPVVEDHDVVGQPVGLLEVLRREDDGGAVAHEVAQLVPQAVAALGVEAGGRLVEEEHARAADEAGGQVEAAAHAPGEGLHQRVGGVDEVELLEELAGPLAGFALGQAVEAADHLEVEPAGEEAVDGGLLRGDADAAAHLVGLVDDVEAGHRPRALGGDGEGGEDADRGGLAGAVVAEEAEHGAGRHVEVEVAEGPEVVVALAEPLGPDAVVRRRSSYRVPMCRT